MLRIVLFLVVSWIAVAASAAERIISFHSDIGIQASGAMLVTETIRVRAEGDHIKRGIYRDFPTRYTGVFGRVVVPFDVMRVTRDGRDEPYHLEARENGTRIYIGRSDARLKPGEYEYGITYRTDWQLGFFADRDELYWNVTGNEWAFPIEAASAAVRLPRSVAADALRLEAYTGRFGGRDRDYRAGVNERNEAVFASTSPLLAGEGLTIVLSWPRGIIPEPTFERRLERWSRDNAEWKPGALSLAILLAYYLLVWFLFGRDPEPGTIIPRFTPPHDVSAADARFLTEMGFDDRVAAAALISLGAKEHVRITDQDGDFAIVADPGPRPEPLTNDEKAFLNALGLRRGSKVELATKNHQILRAARDALKSELRKEHVKRNFVTNGSYTIPGLVISALALLYVSVAAPGGNPASLFVIVWLTGWTFGVYMLLANALQLWRQVFARKFLMVVPAVFITLFSLPFIAGELFGLYMLMEAGSPILVALLFVFVGINYAFYRWLKAPTRVGRKTYDELAGFRMYLAVAEKDRLNLLNPPRRTPELFEKYLPYALALGVENEWSEQFADVLARSRADGARAYHPAWYSGSSWNPSSASAFTGSLAGAISSASSPPGSSSGGGGGGSSGGGGGGGGGGGW